jgi:membrane protease YdiL (CAAX protease family)
MNPAPIEFAELALLACGLLLWIVALARGRALEWFGGPSQLPRWQIAPSEFLAFVAAFGVATYASQLIAAYVFSLDFTEKPMSARTALLNGVATQLGWISVCALFCVPRFFRPPGGVMPWAPAVLAGLTGVLLFFPAGAAVGQLSKLLLPRLGFSDELQDSVNMLRNVDDVGQFFGWVFMVAVLAPVAEEWVFRRLLYRFLAGHTPEWIAIGLSSLLFALLHRNAASFLPLVALGIALCLAYRYTGRMITPIILHAAFNLNSLVYVIMSREP